MAPVQVNKRRREDNEVRRPKKKIKIRKQKDYHSSSEEDEEVEVASTGLPAEVPPKQTRPQRSILKSSTAVAQPEAEEIVPNAEDEDGLDELERNTALNAAPNDDSEDEQEDIAEEEVEDDEDDDDEDDAISQSENEDEDDVSESATSSQPAAQKRKRNDPTAFATSISKILTTKLTTSKRPDPILSRSATATEANKAVSDARLEARAVAQLRAEHKRALDKGRIADVLGLEDDTVDSGVLLEEEKRLKKIAQRGVVRLFNAVRAAQVKGEEARREGAREGVVGMGKRKDRVEEMSKQGFLELISGGGKDVAAV